MFILLNGKKGAYKHTRALLYAVFALVTYFAYSSLQKLFAFDLFFTRDCFARLVAYRTARFASGLTGTSAFATTGYFLVSGFCNRFNHNVPPNFLFFAYKVYAMYLSIIV